MSEENEIVVDFVSDPRPLDLIGNQNMSRDTRDPLNSDSVKESTRIVSDTTLTLDDPTYNLVDSYAQPPPLPILEFFNSAKSVDISDEIKSVVLDALKNVSINGVYPQVSGSSIDFQISDTRESASEKWNYANATANLQESSQTATFDFQIQGPTQQLAESEIEKVHFSDSDIRAMLEEARKMGLLVTVPQSTQNNQNNQNNQQPATQANANSGNGANTNADVINPNSRPVRDRDSDTANPNSRPVRDRDSDTANPNSRPVTKDRELRASRLTPSISPVEASKEVVQTMPVLMRRADVKQPMVAYIMGKGFEEINDDNGGWLFQDLTGSQTNYPPEEYWYPDVFPNMPTEDGLYLLGVTIESDKPQLSWVRSDVCKDA